MKYIKQLAIILGISLIGEGLNYCIPLPIPASIYGLVILFVGLMTGIIKLEMVKETANFLIEIMPIMFVPAGVGLLESWGILQNMLVPAIVITVVSTVVVMIVSGRVTQFMLRIKKGEKTNE
ncbi:MAG: CidA/LrgA family protein [Lachnospiraceae bacterium]|nr:CidA/LrgA family protein [Lachnospiraceae bacterium]